MPNETREHLQNLLSLKWFKLNSPLYAALPSNRERRRAIKQKLDECNFGIATSPIGMEVLKRSLLPGEIGKETESLATLEGITLVRGRSVKRNLYNESDNDFIGGEIKQGQPVVFDMSTANTVTGVHYSWLPDEYKIIGIALEDIAVRDDTDAAIEALVPIRLIYQEPKATFLLGTVVEEDNAETGWAINSIGWIPDPGAGVPAIPTEPRRLYSGKVQPIRLRTGDAPFGASDKPNEWWLELVKFLGEPGADGINYNPTINAINLSGIPCQQHDVVRLDQEHYSGEYVISKIYYPDSTDAVDPNYSGGVVGLPFRGFVPQSNTPYTYCFAGTPGYLNGGTVLSSGTSSVSGQQVNTEIRTDIRKLFKIGPWTDADTLICLVPGRYRLSGRFRFSIITGLGWDGALEEEADPDNIDPIRSASFNGSAYFSSFALEAIGANSTLVLTRRNGGPWNNFDIGFSGEVLLDRGTPLPIFINIEASYDTVHGNLYRCSYLGGVFFYLEPMFT